jgi:hypothetical protein
MNGNSTRCISIESSSDWTEFFVPSCIPQFNKSAVVFCHHNSIKIITTDGWGITILRKVVDISDENRRFADVRVPKGDNLKGVIELRMDDLNQPPVFLIKIVKRMIVNL